MPNLIRLEVVPNQVLSLTADGDRYDLTLRAYRDRMFMSLSRNQVVIMDNMRCMAGVPLLPYLHLFPESGNFIFLTQNNNIPFYTRFGDTDFLYYITREEVGNA